MYIGFNEENATELVMYHDNGEMIEIPTVDDLDYIKDAYENSFDFDELDALERETEDKERVLTRFLEVLEEELATESSVLQLEEFLESEELMTPELRRIFDEYKNYILACYDTYDENKVLLSDYEDTVYLISSKSEEYM